jgi:hypothetical protein
MEVEQVSMALAGILSTAEIDALRRLTGSRGAVSRTEFLLWAAQQPGLGIHQLLRDVFELIDADGSGWLSLDEFAVMTSLLLPSAAPNEAEPE